MISPFILYQFIDFLYKILIFWAEKTGDQNLGGANLRCSTVLKTQGKNIKNSRKKNIKNSRKLGNIDFSVNCDFCCQNSNGLLNKTLSVDLSCNNQH